MVSYTYMNEEKFKELYQQIPYRDERLQRLYDCLGEYYDITENLTNRQALSHRRVFNVWYKAHGYTEDELKRVTENYRRNKK